MTRRGGRRGKSSRLLSAAVFPNITKSFVNMGLMGTIIFFVKFYENSLWAEDFTHGKLFCRTVREIKELEDNSNSGRADKNEGTIAWLQPDQGYLEINGRDLTADLAGATQIKRNWLDDVHLFCVYAADRGNFDLPAKDIEELRQQLLVSEGAQTLGEHAVVVRDIPEFIRRVKSAAQPKGYGVASGLVRYYDPESFHGNFRDVEALFWKQSQYSQQREYRFAIWAGNQSTRHMFLEIGDISDITIRYKTTELNETFLGGSIEIQ